MHALTVRFTYRCSFFPQLVGAFYRFKLKIPENKKSLRVRKKARGRNSQKLVQNLIKDHGCMKSFFNIRAKNRSRRKLSVREQRQHKFLRLNIIYSGVDYEKRKRGREKSDEVFPTTFHRKVGMARL